ncbi:MAG: prephenate dehydrogenase/arogenate dehydrogenase family protein [Candidatus Atribacteria bacterium]|nr:prephenate dehydrogenase/arogenate dehydrogenase family protein [Candidatus Atribacteria bacterium]
MTYSIAIIGLGLMGSSLACDLSQWAKKSSITGYDTDGETQQWCLQKGIVDRIAESPQLAVKGADFVFIATPVRVIPKIYSEIHSLLLPQTIIFDLGSTRQWIFDHLVPAPNNHLYCGFHPMGGGVNSGAHSAQKQLFKGRPLLVTPFRPFRDSEMNIIEEIAHCLGSRVFF